MKLQAMTWPEIDELDPAEIAVLFPVAAIEQHGPHLPLGTDSFITTGLARRLEERDPGRILLGPTQQVGSSPHHLVFPGTLTLSSRTFLDVMGELVDSLARAGFRKFIYLNGHGGNQALLNVAVQEARLARPGIQVLHATYWTLAAEAFRQIRESSPGGMGHAGEMETSVMLTLHPDLVRMELARPDGRECPGHLDHRDMLEPGRVGLFRYWDEWSEKGVLGDPTTATAEKGERFLDAAVEALLVVVDDLLAGKYLERDRN